MLFLHSFPQNASSLNISYTHCSKLKIVLNEIDTFQFQYFPFIWTLVMSKMVTQLNFVSVQNNNSRFFLGIKIEKRILRFFLRSKPLAETSEWSEGPFFNQDIKENFRIIQDDFLNTERESCVKENAFSHFCFRICENSEFWMKVFWSHFAP